jgi:integrase
MLPKNIYEHAKFYELKMMIQGQRINRSFAYSSKRDKDKALVEAIAFKEAMLDSFEKYGVALNRNPSKVKFIKLVELYERVKIKEEKSKTKTENLLKLAKERFPALMNTLLIDLKPKNFEDVKEYLIENKYSKATVNHYLSQFSGVLIFAKTNGFNIENYTINLQYELDNIHTEILSREELKMIVDELKNERTKLAIQFLFFTACRRSEVVNMKFEDIDFKKKTLALKETKNGKSHNVVLNSSCITILERLKELDGGEGYVFKSYETGLDKPVHIDCWTRAWRRAVKRLCKRTEDKKWLRKKLHTLRHSRITEYAAKVTSAIVLQDITGHKDLRSLSRYSHTTDETKRSQLGELADE